MSKIADAQKIIAAFAARTTGGNLWPSLDRAKVAAGAAARINNPDFINQGDAYLCGPSCLVHAVATDAPQDYAQAIVDLYETGKACLGGSAQCLSLKPGSDLMNYTLPAGVQMDQADWIILASIRDSENWFYDYSSISQEWRAGTSARELKNWFKESGYTDVQDKTTDKMGWLSALGFWADEASDLYVKGYKVCLKINTNMLKNARESSNRSNHLVALTSPITFKYVQVYIPPHRDCFYEGRHRECTIVPGGLAPVPNLPGLHPDPDHWTVSFWVYTWGGKRQLTMSFSEFMGNFYGYVAGKY